MGNLFKILVPIAIVGISIGAFALLGAAKPEPEKNVDPPRPLSVYIKSAEAADVALRVSTSGEVRAQTNVNLVAQIAGRVVSVSSEFTEGGKVSPGETLVKIEDTDFQLALSQAQALVASAEVAVQEAEAGADVARKQLRNTSNASPLALKKPQVAQALAGLKAAKAQLAQAELNLSRTKITLPFDGRIKEKMVDVGQYVSPGTLLGKAFATDLVQIRLPLNDDQLASLGLPIGFVATDDTSVKVELSAIVAGKKQHWTGQLVRLDASIDPETRAIYGQVAVHSPYDLNVSENNMPLAVGLYVEADILGREIDNATLIPREALRAGDNVYVVNKDQRLEVRQVTVAQSSGDDVVIESGVEPNERVIVSSIRNPIPGMSLTALVSNDQSAIASQKPVDTFLAKNAVAIGDSE